MENAIADSIGSDVRNGAVIESTAIPSCIIECLVRQNHSGLRFVPAVGVNVEVITEQVRIARAIGIDRKNVTTTPGTAKIGGPIELAAG